MVLSQSILFIDPSLLLFALIFHQLLVNMATRTLFANASLPSGAFKPLQSTNYVLSADFGTSGEEISLTKGRLVEHWKDSFTKMVLVYHPPDIFQGMFNLLL